MKLDKIIIMMAMTIATSIIMVASQEAKLAIRRYDLPFFEDRRCDMMKAGGWLIAARCGAPDSDEIVVTDILSFIIGREKPFAFTDVTLSSLEHFELQPVTSLYNYTLQKVNIQTKRETPYIARQSYMISTLIDLAHAQSRSIDA